MSPKEQPLSQEDIEKHIAQRVTNSIEAIDIYKTKTRVACDSMDQIIRQGAKVEKNANNKRKWEGQAIRKNMLGVCLCETSASCTIPGRALSSAEIDKMERLTRLYLKELVLRHVLPASIISDRDSRVTSATNIRTSSPTPLRKATQTEF
ncbi:hypothetical protein Tco_0365624 [Tanacetum coccineum]